jgi:hypothetical protein
VLECLRKLLLTGVAIQVAPGSLLQLVVSIVIIVAYIYLVAFFQPYKNKRDNTLALGIYAVIAITLFCGLLLKVKDGYESTGKYDDGFSTTTIAAMLVLSVVFVAATAVVLTIYDIRRLSREPLLRYVQGGCVVMLPPLAKHQVFDLFLSHAQDLGQDQVATIKGALEKLLPSVKIFLDVECLDDLHVLDDLVKGSAAVLLFLTKDCLRRHFVRLEIETAVQSKIKMIVVQETDVRHGSAPMATHREDCPEETRGALFEPKHQEILWIRAANFRTVSIKQIVQRMIVGQDAECPKLQLPGELSSCYVCLPPLSPVLGMHHFWLPNFARWCPKLDACLRESMPGLEVKVADPGELASLQARGQAKRVLRSKTNLGYLMSASSGGNQGTSYRVTSDEDQTVVAHALLLPLNKDTLLNAKVLADLYAAMQLGMHLAIVHLQEEEYDSAPFGTFFTQCPAHLQVGAVRNRNQLVSFLLYTESLS